VTATTLSTTRRRSEPCCEHIAESEDPSILSRIEEAEIGLVLWKRTLPVRLAEWLEWERHERLPEDRKLVRLKNLKTALDAMVKPHGATRGIARFLLCLNLPSLASPELWLP
jgi:Protein of unknown function (DUF1826)